MNILFRCRLSYFEIFPIEFAPPDRTNVFCIDKRSKPIPNSIAEKMRKKKVKEIKFMSSIAYPTKSVNAYNITHSISAVNNKCKKEMMLVERLKSNNQNNNNKIFISPNIKNSN